MGLFSKKPPSTVALRDGTKLACSICGHDRFSVRQGLISNPFTAWLDMEWLHRSAQCFVCAGCGYVHWFYWDRAGVRRSKA